jgi:hypothetical protein
VEEEREGDFGSCGSWRDARLSMGRWKNNVTWTDTLLSF